MGFAIMSMTETAANRVKAIVENSGSEAKGIRVGIKKGGCAGMEYTIDLGPCIVHPEGRAACGGDAEAFQERHGAMRSGANRNTAPVDHRRDVMGCLLYTSASPRDS